MTQPRALTYYLALLFFPNLRGFSLYHDDFNASTGLLDPVTTLISILFLGAVVGVAVFGLKRRVMLAFACLWFLVGHGVESTILGLELVHEHRNYIPSYGVLFGLIFYAFKLIDKRPDLRRLAVLVGAAFLSVVMFVTHTRASVWGSLDELIHFTVRNHPNSYRALMEQGTALERRGFDVKDIYATYLKAAGVNPHVGNPVMRMQRIVSGLIYNLSEQDMIPDQLETQPHAARWDGPLFVDLPYLEALDVLVAQEFTDRLSNTPLNAELMIALREFQQCATTRADSCPPTSRVDDWADPGAEQGRHETYSTSRSAVDPRASQSLFG